MGCLVCVLLFFFSPRILLPFLRKLGRIGFFGSCELLWKGLLNFGECIGITGFWSGILPNMVHYWWRKNEWFCRGPITLFLLNEVGFLVQLNKLRVFRVLTGHSHPKIHIVPSPGCLWNASRQSTLSALGLSFRVPKLSHSWKWLATLTTSWLGRHLMRIRNNNSTERIFFSILLFLSWNVYRWAFLPWFLLYCRSKTTSL